MTRCSLHAVCLASVLLAAISGPLRAEEPGARTNRALATAAAAAQPERVATLRLISVEPTVFLEKASNALLQVAEATVENTGDAVEANLQIGLPGSKTAVALGQLGKGRSAVQFRLPEIREPAPIGFVLMVGRVVHDRRTIDWRPQRRWEVCFVPVSHHDLGYTDSLENVLYKYDGFYDDVLRFCEETGDWPEEARFRYTVEGAWSLQHYVERRSPAVVDKLAKYARQGRIDISALMGNEVTNLCGHEEFVRALYPSARLAKRLGATVRTGSITDIPGLSWALPSALAGAGGKYFFAGLPDYFTWGGMRVHTFWDEAAVLRQPRPDAFRWKGPDGKSVLVYYQGSYGFWGAGPTPTTYQAAAKRLPGLLADMEKAGTPFSVMRYGVAGCGDNTPPEICISQVVREWNARWAYPRLWVATNTMFFEKLEKQCGDVRVFRGELPDTDYVVGATSTTEETAVNRVTHDRLPVAEKFATIASLLLDADYPAEQIRNAYDDMLLYDEHTWGMSARQQPGPVQDWDWSDKGRYAHRAAGLTETCLQTSLPRIAGAIARKERGGYITVFNPLSFERTDVVRLTAFEPKGPVEIVDPQTGEVVPHQVVELDGPRDPVPYAAQRYARSQFEPFHRRDLVFVAEAVPAMGWKTYRLRSVAKDAPAAAGLSIGQHSLESPAFKVLLDSKTGAVRSIFDKQLGREIVDPRAAHQLNQLVARRVDTGAIQCPQNAQVRVGQRGPVYASLVASSTLAGCPQVTQEVRVYDKLGRIEVANRVLADSTPLAELYFAFPLQVEKPRFRFEGTNSVIEPFGDQFPGSNTNYYAVQHWANVSGGGAGVMLSAVDSHLMEFGGLWPCYVSQAHHGLTPPGFGRDFVKPSEISRGHIYAFVRSNNFRTNFPLLRQGDLLFRYSIATHPGDGQAGAARDFGWAAANPLPAVLRAGGKNQGPLPETMSFCQTQPDNLLVPTLKRAEDGQGLIVRVLETEGKTSNATLTFPRLLLRKAFLANLVEENQGELSVTDHQVTAPVKAFAVTTIRIQTR